MLVVDVVGVDVLVVDVFGGGCVRCQCVGYQGHVRCDGRGLRARHGGSIADVIGWDV